MNNVFQISVTADDQRQEYWAISDDARTLASMLADSSEADAGACITIKPADLASMIELTANVDRVTSCCQSQGDIAVLVRQVIQVLLPTMAVKNPRTFLAFYLINNGELWNLPRQAHRLN